MQNCCIPITKQNCFFQYLFIVYSLAVRLESLVANPTLKFQLPFAFKPKFEPPKSNFTQKLLTYAFINAFPAISKLFPYKFEVKGERHIELINA